MHPAGRRRRAAGLPLAQRKPKRRPSATKRAARAGHLPTARRSISGRQKPHLRASSPGLGTGILMQGRPSLPAMHFLSRPPARHPADAAGGERSRLTLARRLLSKDADLAASAIVGELRWLPARARRTVTHDNGGEFARHEAVTSAIGLHAYFSRPAQPLAARLDRERQRPAPTRPSPQDQPRRIYRRRHRRRHLEPQRNTSKVPRIPHPHRGIRCQPRCRT